MLHRPPRLCLKRYRRIWKKLEREGYGKNALEVVSTCTPETEFFLTVGLENRTIPEEAVM